MIRGIHGLLYSSDPEATRAFFRELVRLPGNDVGEGWWVFDFPEGDLGVHPIEDGADAGKHDVSFYCDDIQGTVRVLESRGVIFAGPIEDHGYGLVTHFDAPGGIRIQLYEPRYSKGASRAGSRAPRKRAPARGRKAQPARKAAAGKRARKRTRR